MSQCLTVEELQEFIFKMIHSYNKERKVLNSSLRRALDENNMLKEKICQLKSPENTLILKVDNTTTSEASLGLDFSLPEERYLQ